MTKHRLLFVSLLVASSGCTSYYKVHDNSSGREYITNNWVMGQNMYTGSMGLTDLKTNKQVILQNYEMQKMTEEDAKAEVAAAKSAPDTSAPLSAGIKHY